MRVNCLISCSVLVLVLGCGGKQEGVEGDSDTDTSDTGEDTDTDGGGGVSDADFVGTISYATTMNGEVECSAVIDLEGMALQNSVCSDCDFVFSIESSIASDSSTADCSLEPLLSFVESNVYSDFTLGFATTRSHYGTDYNGALVVGHMWYGESGPYYELIAHDSHPYGAVDYDDDAIGWTYDYIDEYYTFGSVNYYGHADCDDYTFAGGQESFGGDYQGTSSLGCDELLLDVWTVDFDSGDGRSETSESDDGGVSEDGVLRISVDTVAADTAFDPWLGVYGANECLFAETDDNFVCTYEPLWGWLCPSVELYPQDGPYKIVVGGHGSCVGDAADYQITVDAPSDPNLTLMLDDTNRFEDYEAYERVHTIAGSGSIHAFQ